MKERFENFLHKLKNSELDDKIIGREYEHFVANTFKEFFDLEIISNKTWKESYGELRQKYLEHNKDELFYCQNHNLLVLEPNDSQQSPDILVILNGIGFFIDAKTSKTQHPMWNSGKTKGGGFYIFKNYEKKNTTFFLKQDIIDKDTEYIIDCSLEILKRHTKELNENLSHTNWNISFRPILTDKNNYSDIDLNTLREENVKTFFNKLFAHNTIL